MQQVFEQHITQNFPQLFDQRVLVAVSGGLDSVVLTYLLYALNIRFELAHCNFSLRDEESDKDEQFVNELAIRLDLEIHNKLFKTKEEASKRGVSTQMAARDLRYNWFKEILKDQQLAAVLTGHHLDDQIETFLINLNRGTGIAGLTGIPEQSGQVIRPLLPFSREQLLKFAQDHHLKWREDSSNTGNDYQRNKLRNLVLPALHEALPNLRESFENTIRYLKDARSILDDAVYRFRQSVTTTTCNGFEIHIARLLFSANYEKYLFHILQPYGFMHMAEVTSLTKAQTGKYLSSATHILLKDREVLRLELKEENVVYQQQILRDTSSLEMEGTVMSIEMLKPDHPIEFVEDHIDKNVLLLDAQRIEYPLTLRVWESGDKLEPYGMDGSQLVSDILINNKISLLDKKRCFVLESMGTILWLVGIRSSRHHMVTAQTKEIIKITWGI